MDPTVLRPRARGRVSHGRGGEMADEARITTLLDLVQFLRGVENCMGRTWYDVVA